jgi:hypothetical protein
MTKSTKYTAFASAAAVAAMALPGCGSSSSSPDATKFLDNEKIERSIEGSILQQRHKPAAAQCPALELKKKGVVFTCIAITRNGVRTPFKVTEVDGNGHVKYVGIRAPRGAQGKTAAGK